MAMTGHGLSRAVMCWSTALVAAIVLMLVPAGASAHNMPTSAVLLDIHAHDVGGELEFPVDRLAIALKQ